MLKANQGPLYKANSLPLDDIDRGVMSDLQLKLDQPTTRDPTSLASAPKDPGTHITLPNNVASAVGLTPDQYNTWSNYLIKRESGGNYSEPPNKEGYMGLYQMGSEEISEAAKRVGIPVPSQEDFLANKDHVQDRLFENYTLQHHQELMKNPIYANAPPQQKSAILMGAHLGGVEGVQKYLTSGGKYNPADSNGTHISDYVNGTLATMNGDPIGGIGSAGSLETFQQSHQQAQQLVAQEQQRLDSVLKQLGSSKGDTQERRRLLQDSLDRSRALQDQMLQLAQNPPTKKPTDLLSTFGSLAMLIGAIGGLKSRQPATAALQAAAGVIEGVNTNNEQEFDRNLKVWQSQSKLLSELTGIQAQDFRTIMENDRLDESERHNRLEETLTAYGMQDSLDKLHMGLMEEAWKGPYTIMTLDQELKKSIAQVGEINAHAARERQLGAAGGKVTDYVDTGTLDAQGHPTPYSEDGFGNKFKIEMQTDPSTGESKQVRIPYNPVSPAKIGTGSQGAANPQSEDNIAKAIANYDMAPITSWGMNKPFGQNVMAKVRQLNPDYDATKWQAKLRGQVAFTTGKQGDTLRFFSVATDHLSTMEEAATALGNGNVRLLNKARNEIKNQLGYEGPVDFNFVKSIVGAEVNKAVQGQAGALSDREELRANLDGANSPEQLAGVARFARKLIAGQLKGLRIQSKAIGMSQEEFDSRLSDQAKKELENIQAPGIPDWASKALKEHPDQRDEFDNKFGFGSAARVLGQ
jgi:hypothetical protein